MNSHQRHMQQQAVSNTQRFSAPTLSEQSAPGSWMRRTAKAMLALYLCQTILAVLPAQAFDLPVAPWPNAPAGQRPLMDAAQNGVPIVLIAPPSAGGVSRNQYDQFNVNKNGLILNNGTGNTQTQLGGWVSGNPQLGVTPARIILNEVVSNNPSQLRGTIEVAGQRANIVVANPNGIVCDGCGFLNTSRASVTTGQTRFGANGAINGFDVGQGQLTIGSGGLNASNVEQLDLIARGLVIEGEVWARNLNTLAGANQLLYGTVQATPQAGTGAAPRFAIDIKDLGGMYANQVYLVSTEQGLGVNSSGRVAALQGNLVLSANGDLTLKDSYAKQNIQLTANGNTSLTGQTQSDGSTTIASASVSNVGGTLLANGQLAVTTAGKLDNTGGKLLGGQAAILNAQQLVNDGNGLVASDQGTRITTTQGISNQGGVLSGKTALTINANGAAINNTAGTLVSDAALNVSAGALDNTRGQVTTRAQNGGAATLNLASLSNRQGVVDASGSLAVSASGTIDNTQGSIASGTRIAGSTTIQSARLTNNGGQIVARDALAINTGTLNNDAIEANKGILASNSGAVTVNAGSVSNVDGLVTSATGTTLNTQALNSSGGEISSGAALAINTSGQGLTNTGGRILANGNVDIQAGTIASNANGAQTALISSGSNLNVRGTALNNDGSTIVAGNTTDASAGKVDLELGGGILSNHGGAVQSTNAITVNAGAVNNQSGQITANNTVSVTAASVNNSTGLIDGVSTNINAGATDNTGRIYGDQLTIRGGTVNNSGSGTIAARNTLLIGVQNLNNTEGGLIYSLGDIGIAGAIDANGNLQGSAQNLLNASARIEAQGTLAIAAANLTNRDNHLVTKVVNDPTIQQNQIQPSGSATKYKQSDCFGVGGGGDKVNCIVHPDKYGQRSSITTARTVVPDRCSGSGDGQTCIPGYTVDNYAWNAPVFAQFGVTPVTSAAPAEPNGTGGCAFTHGGTSSDVTTPACIQWRKDDAGWRTAYEATLDQLAVRIASYNASVNEDNRLDQFEDYTWYKVTASPSHTGVVSSAPAQILSGGSMVLNGSVTNQDSQIVAGGPLSIVGATVRNLATQGESRTTYSGTAEFTHVETCGILGNKHCRNWDGPQAYNPAAQVISADLPTVVYQQNAGNQTNNRDLTVATTNPDGSIGHALPTVQRVNADSAAGQCRRQRPACA